jgi:hypothetical protein
MSGYLSDKNMIRPWSLTSSIALDAKGIARAIPQTEQPEARCLADIKSR